MPNEGKGHGRAAQKLLSIHQNMEEAQHGLLLVCGAFAKDMAQMGNEFEWNSSRRARWEYGSLGKREEAASNFHRQMPQIMERNRRSEPRPFVYS